MSGTSAIRGRLSFIWVLLPGVALVLTGCTATKGGKVESAGSVVVINAPAAGWVRRVLVNEGVSVSKGMPVIEVVANDEAQPGPDDSAEVPGKHAARSYSASVETVEQARNDVMRAQFEVQRLAPLVAANQAPQSQLDAATMKLNQAQSRLQSAQNAQQSAQTALSAAQNGRSQFAEAPVVSKREKLLTADSTAEGTVAAISVKPGDTVKEGQPIATIRVAGQIP
jgi:multidrug efflux pump subunit AcrA (membrane-fusion protein)